MWLEIFILPGYNDSEQELTALKKAIQRINPDSVQLNTLDRPGTVASLRGATREELESIIRFWGLDNIEIISASPERKKVESYRTDAEAAIMDTIARRPCTAIDLSKILGMHISEINKYLDVLEAEQKIMHKEGSRGIFYQLKAGES
jgi:wyosine [tRNA(Phe)-imidazoG37] synthetase (radical SAM superfamily)